MCTPDTISNKTLKATWGSRSRSRSPAPGARRPPLPPQRRASQREPRDAGFPPRQRFRFPQTRVRSVLPAAAAAVRTRESAPCRCAWGGPAAAQRGRPCSPLGRPSLALRRRPCTRMDIWVALTRSLLEATLSRITLHTCHCRACVEDIRRTLLLDTGESGHWAATETRGHRNGRRQITRQRR